MLVELVNTQTADSLRLDGALLMPEGTAANSFGFEAAILFSGVGSNFYGSTLMEHMAKWLAGSGIATLSVNTRGHDGVSTAAGPGGGRLLQAGAGGESDAVT